MPIVARHLIEDPGYALLHVNNVVFAAIDQQHRLGKFGNGRSCPDPAVGPPPKRGQRNDCLHARSDSAAILLACKNCRAGLGRQLAEHAAGGIIIHSCRRQRTKSAHGKSNHPDVFSVNRIAQLILRVCGKSGEMIDHRALIRGPIDQYIAERDSKFWSTSRALIAMVNRNHEIALGCQILGQPGHECIPAIVAVRHNHQRIALACQYHAAFDGKAGDRKRQPLAIRPR